MPLPNSPNALQIIMRAMRLAQVNTKGETPDNEEAQDGLYALNAMLNSWQLERLYVYRIKEETFTWAANQQEQTIGASGDFVTDRPTRIADDCYFVINSVTYQSRMIDVDAWSAIPDKSTTSTWPWYLYPEYGVDEVTLHGWPIPNASVEFHLRTWQQLQYFSALTDTMDLPPGYQRAIEFSLAEEFGPEFGVTITPDVRMKAANARKAIRNINSPSPIMASEAGLMTRTRGSYIYGDWGGY